MQHTRSLPVDAEIQWPCPLQETTRQRLLSIAQPYELNWRTGPLPGVIYVATGCVVGYATNETMDNSLGLMYGHGRWFGIQSIDNPTYAPTSLYEALLPTELLLFPARELERLVEQDPEIYKFLFFIAQYIGRITLQLGSNTLFCLTTRIIYVLLELADKPTSLNEAQPLIHITQQSLSQIVGISRPRVNEVLKTLDGSGEIKLGRGEIRLLDIATLRARLPAMSYMHHDPIAGAYPDAPEPEPQSRN